jgi:hypothetical protein
MLDVEQPEQIVISDLCTAESVSLVAMTCRGHSLRPMFTAPAP